MNLVQDNDPILHKSNQLISDEQFSDSGRELVPIVSMLVSKMEELGVNGISACQIGIDLALFVIGTGGRIRVCANPQIVAAAASMVKSIETCPSFPGLVLRVNRPDAVVVRYQMIDGTETVEQLDGIDASTWLHEYDHTQGICFTDRVSRLALGMARKKVIKAQKRSGNGF